SESMGTPAGPSHGPVAFLLFRGHLVIGNFGVTAEGWGFGHGWFPSGLDCRAILRPPEASVDAPHASADARPFVPAQHIKPARTADHAIEQDGPARRFHLTNDRSVATVGSFSQHGQSLSRGVL